jgi:hypothetical protein
MEHTVISRGSDCPLSRNPLPSIKGHTALFQRAHCPPSRNTILKQGTHYPPPRNTFTMSFFQEHTAYCQGKHRLRQGKHCPLSRNTLPAVKKHTHHVKKHSVLCQGKHCLLSRNTLSSVMENTALCQGTHYPLSCKLCSVQNGLRLSFWRKTSA